MAFQSQRPQQGSREQQMAKTPRFGDILDIAWSQHGLKRVSTAIVQFPTEENGWTTIVHATVETDRGQFTAIGDANPKNAGPMIAPHSIRFAESRAIARALRWATNAGEAVDVEMGDYVPDDAPRTSRTEAGPASAGRQPQQPPLAAAGGGTPPPSDRATPEQVAAIYARALEARGMTEGAVDNRCRELFGVPVPELTTAQAVKLMQSLEKTKQEARS